MILKFPKRHPMRHLHTRPAHLPSSHALYMCNHHPHTPPQRLHLPYSHLPESTCRLAISHTLNIPPDRPSPSPHLSLHHPILRLLVLSVHIPWSFHVFKHVSSFPFLFILPYRMFLVFPPPLSHPLLSSFFFDLPTAQPCNGVVISWVCFVLKIRNRSPRSW